MSNNQDSTKIFNNIASAIASKYTAQVSIIQARAGGRPSFDELMGELKSMEQELTKEGVSFLENNSSGTADDHNELTENIKQIIHSTIEGFIKQL